ncbi:MAG: ComEA family DNA-binding protein [Chloroflexi bacterium]|nr:ComEA family DNA-binding protein [Chloroflexota bacterium]MCC6893339.1 ComEA family DNA-binding protein [Anaerolineae bacterium]
MYDSPPTEPSPRSTLIAFAILLVALVAGAVVLLSSRPQPVEFVIKPPEPTFTPAPTSTFAPITVYVTGAVANPEQTITLPYRSRVVDALDAAGGTTAEADLALVNPASFLHDGDQIHVPIKGQTVTLPTPNGGVVIHINTATAEELDPLPGIGPTLAADIIAYREANGMFRGYDDLDDVPGVGPALIDGLQGLIAFD